MKRFRIVFLMVFLFSSAFIRANYAYEKDRKLENLPIPAQTEILINTALRDIDSPFALERRMAVKVLSTNYKAPGIQRAVYPLEDVLLNTYITESIYTRSIAAVGLGKIAKSLGPNPWGDQIVGTLSLMSEHGEFDVIRAAAVRGLGETENPAAIPPLLTACSDESLPVSTIADQYLFLRTGQGCGQPNTAYSLSSASRATVSSDQEPEVEWQDYLNRHLISIP